MCSTIRAWQFWYHGNILGSRPFHIKSFSGHLWGSILIFTNSTSCAWSSKQIDMLARVCSFVYHFSSWKSLTYWNQVGGVWKRVSCHGNGIFYSHRCVSCRTISLPSFNVLHCKLAEIARLYTWYNIGLSIWRHQSSHLHILPNISGTNVDICKRKRRCFSARHF